jgi:hypothetical protein
MREGLFHGMPEIKEVPRRIDYKIVCRAGRARHTGHRSVSLYCAAQRRAGELVMVWRQAVVVPVAPALAGKSKEQVELLARLAVALVAPVQVEHTWMIRLVVPAGWQVVCMVAVLAVLVVAAVRVARLFRPGLVLVPE